MAGISVNLLRNKQNVTENIEDYRVIAGENNATTVLVTFPEEYENYSKRVDFKNIRKEKWTLGLYTPEDPSTEYDSNFDKLNFAFTIPDAVSVNGELQIQFIAYLADGSETLVPFQVIKIEVEESILYATKQGSRNPDLIVSAFANSNRALEIAEDAFSRIENAERAALAAEASARSAQNSATSAQNSATSANTRAQNAETSAQNAENSARSAQQSAQNAENSANTAVTNSNTAIQTANTANTKSNNAVATANTANTKADKVVEIIDTLTVSSEEIGSEEQIAVEIQTNQSNQHKNIKFSIPAPKQGKSYRNLGDWNATTNYVNNTYYIDTVFYEGCSYFCKVSNKNKTPIPSEESEYWGLLAIKGSDAGVVIVDNLDSDRSDYVLSAKQGKVLKEINCNVVQRSSNGTETTINNIVLVEV